MNNLAKGDRQALKDIYVEYMPYVFSVIMSVLKNKENSEDVCSDFFIKLMNIAGDFRGGNGHKAYLATIARNMALDHLRKYKKEELVNDFEGTYHDQSDDGSEVAIKSADVQSHDSAEQEYMQEKSVKDALDTLPPPEPEIMNLKIMGQLTFREIAEALKLPMGTVTWHYRQAIERLRRYGYA